MNKTTNTLASHEKTVDVIKLSVTIVLVSASLLLFGYIYTIGGVDRNLWIGSVLGFAILGYFVPKVAAILIALLVPLHFYAISPFLAIILLAFMLLFFFSIPKSGVGRYWIAIIALLFSNAVMAGNSFIYLIIPIQLACLMCFKYTRQLSFIFPSIITILLLFGMLSTENPGVSIDDISAFIDGGYKDYPTWKADFLNLFNYDTKNHLMSVLAFWAVVFIGTIISSAMSMKIFIRIRQIGLADLAITLMTGGIFSATLFFRTQYVDSVYPLIDLITVMVLSIMVYGITRVLHVYPVLASATDSAACQIADGRMMRNCWNNISGYEKAKQEILEALRPYTRKAERRSMQAAGIKPVKGLLLFGPPGTGKTMLARGIASATKMNIITVSGLAFVSKQVEENETALRDVFSKARAFKPCVLFFDGLESYLRPRNESRQSSDITTVTTFLSGMDGLQELKDVLLVGTLNLPGDIDAAAIRPGRFDKIIYIGIPNLEDRIAIWGQYLNKKADMRHIDLSLLAEMTDHYTGADIKGISEELFRANKYKFLTQQQIMTAIASTKPTVTPDMREQHEREALRYTRNLNAPVNVNTGKEGRYGRNAIAGIRDRWIRMQSRTQITRLITLIVVLAITWTYLILHETLGVQGTYYLFGDRTQAEQIVFPRFSPAIFHGACRFIDGSTVTYAINGRTISFIGEYLIYKNYLLWTTVTLEGTVPDGARFETELREIDPFDRALRNTLLFAEDGSIIIKNGSDIYQGTYHREEEMISIHLDDGTNWPHLVVLPDRILAATYGK
ncbi:MAG: ATP-binding protein [Bacillota bacterium]|nr:ATP-binding protein [Bacillota bacterium]